MTGNFMQNNKFEYNYSAPTEEERKEIESIRRAYSPQSDNRIERVRKLDRRVKLPAAITLAVMLVAGTLIFGTGLTLVLEWDILVWGSIVAASGAAIFALAFPLRKYLLKRGKEKYGKLICELSDELLKTSD